MSLERLGQPVIACTAEELGRLRAAYAGGGPEHEVVAGLVARADRAMEQPLTFPPRGGQHNQWYQCDNCQIALETVDPTHHRCPQCGQVYSGEPYDDVLFANIHSRNLGTMTNAAWAYAITGDDKYAAQAADILLGYADRYRSYPYHSAARAEDESKIPSGGHLAEQTLNESGFLSRLIAPAYDLIHDSSVLSAADHEAIRKGLLLPMLENIDKHKAGKSNWQSWHNAGMLWGGAVLGDETWVRKAIEDPDNGFLHQMQVSVTDDGMWYENSWGYHFYTVRALTTTAEAAQRIGIDLWGDPRLKKMFTLAPRYAMPDGSLPRFGDDVQTSLASTSDVMEAAYQAYGDERILAVLPVKATWESVLTGREIGEAPAGPALNSEVFEAAGHAILRTDGEAGLAAVMTFGPYGGFHGHFDKLSFVLFGYGRELGVDPGRAKSQAYRLPIHQDWYRATLGHNAVVVDAASQQPAAGALALFAANEHYAAAAARCDEAYPGVEHLRLLCMTPSYLLVFDDLRTDRTRQFDWVYHSRGGEVQWAGARLGTDLDRRYIGHSYVQNITGGKANGPIRVRVVDGDVTTHLTMDDQTLRTLVRIGDGVGESIVDRVPMAMVTRRGKHVQFAAAIEPVQGDGARTIESIRIERLNGTSTITVNGRGFVDVIELTEGNRLVVTHDERVVLRRD